MFELLLPNAPLEFSVTTAIGGWPGGNFKRAWSWLVCWVSSFSSHRPLEGIHVTNDT